MRRVLCCLDDSEQSRATIRYAALLAEAFAHELVLVHVAPGAHAPGVSAAPAGRERLREQEQADADDLLTRLAKEADLGPDVRLRADVGGAAERIVALCEEEDASVVVMGSRGRGGLKAAMLGSTSAAVAASAPCPCMIVSPTAAARVGAMGGVSPSGPD